MQIHLKDTHNPNHINKILTISVNSVQDSPIPQKVLSGMIQALHFHILFESSPPANRAALAAEAHKLHSRATPMIPSPGWHFTWPFASPPLNQ